MTTVLLLIIGILLIVVNIKVIRKDDKKFKNILDNALSDIKDYDLEIGKLKKEFAETVMELQLEIEALKDKVKSEDEDIKKNLQHKLVKKRNESCRNVENNVVMENGEYEVNLNNRSYAVKNYEKGYIDRPKEAYKDDSLLENNTDLINKYSSKKKVLLNTMKIDNINNVADEIDSREINNVKIDDIERLMEQGLSIDNISEKLGIGKGEILLIKKLYLK